MMALIELPSLIRRAGIVAWGDLNCLVGPELRMVNCNSEVPVEFVARPRACLKKHMVLGDFKKFK